MFMSFIGSRSRYGVVYRYGNAASKQVNLFQLVIELGTLKKIPNCIIAKKTLSWKTGIEMLFNTKLSTSIALNYSYLVKLKINEIKELEKNGFL